MGSGLQTNLTDEQLALLDRLRSSADLDGPLRAVCLRPVLNATFLSSEDRELFGHDA